MGLDEEPFGKLVLDLVAMLASSRPRRFRPIPFLVATNPLDLIPQILERPGHDGMWGTRLLQRRDRRVVGSRGELLAGRLDDSRRLLGVDRLRQTVPQIREPGGPFLARLRLMHPFPTHPSAA